MDQEPQLKKGPLFKADTFISCCFFKVKYLCKLFSCFGLFVGDRSNQQVALSSHVLVLVNT